MYRVMAFTWKEKFDVVLSVFSRIQYAMSCCNKFPAFNFKPQQIQCWCHLLEGKQVIGLLPTGFGKSTIFQLLPFILSPHELHDEEPQNIVIVAGPLSSIMADQMKFLTEVGITNGALRHGDYTLLKMNKLFPDKPEVNEDISSDEEVGDDRININQIEILPKRLFDDSDEEGNESVEFTREPVSPE